MKIQKLFIICPLLIFSIITFNLQTSNADPLANWHWRNPLPHVDHLNAVTFGNNMFVAVGDYGLILTSPDDEHLGDVV